MYCSNFDKRMMILPLKCHAPKDVLKLKAVLYQNGGTVSISEGYGSLWKSV